MLTDLAAKGAKPRDKDYKLADSGGLYLFVTTKGAKVWRLKYRIAGKPQTLVLGRYPEMRLAAARELRDIAKRAITAGRDPRLDAKRAKLVAGGEDTSFERFARDWFEAQKGRWKPIHADDVITSMERDLFPKIGAFPVTEIDQPLFLSAMRAVEERGAIETAHRIRQRAERVFKWARSHGAGNGNPAADVRDAMAPAKPKRRWPALTDMDELRRLVRDVDAAGASPITRLASRFMGIVAQRPGMIRGMVWDEVEGVDWDDVDADVSKALWRIPADRMKQERELREDEAFEHVVPLARQAVDALRAVRVLTGRGPLPFCSIRDAHEPISENAVGYLYNRIGYQRRHVPHGWRSSFSTTMNARAAAILGESRLILDRLVIDLMLAHRPTGLSSDEFRYNRGAYADRRREIAQDWADMLMRDALPAAALLGTRRRDRR